jgi:hypothetical protein
MFTSSLKYLSSIVETWGVTSHPSPPPYLSYFPADHGIFHLKVDGNEK